VFFKEFVWNESIHPFPFPAFPITYTMSTTANTSSQHAQDAVLAVVRELQQESVATSRGRTVLTIIYLCVLGLCFITPVLYYFRMHFEERNAARSRAQENIIIRASLGQSGDIREDARNTRRKYVEERRARMLQLFEPVRMVSS
jgi:hypothetical protein